MAKMTIVRPGTMLDDDRREELGKYCFTQFLRAKRGRADQVDGQYEGWSKAYTGIPLEEVRSVPFYKSSNFVVKLIRIFADTFMARTLNIIFATQPLYVVDGLPRDVKEAWVKYINSKALYQWDHYWLARALITGGNKNGTAVPKTVWETDETIFVGPNQSEQTITMFEGPRSIVVPFDDFYAFPITAECLRDVEIKFHRVRYTEERAKQLAETNIWDLPRGTDDKPRKDIEEYCRHPLDQQRETQKEDAGITDPLLRELHTIECHLQWPITNDPGKLYSVVCLIEEYSGDVFDVYFNPVPQNMCMFSEYKPFPRENLFFGESLAQILGQSQEEASRIHNERRDNSTIASSVVFKRKKGSLLPNPSTNWYPGKVWDLDSMDDLDMINVGRNYDDMIQQEDYVFQLAEKLTGTSEVLQGASSGTMGKRGVYNTGGTIAMMQESNQRQDTNIRDVRTAMSATAILCSMQQAAFGQDDPFIQTFDPDTQKLLKQAFGMLKGQAGRYIRHEVKASDAGVNKEVEKMNLMQCAQTLGQYGQAIQGMVTQLANPTLNPAIKAVILATAQMQKWMAQRLLEQFDEFDAKELIPDVADIMAQNQPQPQQGGPPGAGPGGPGGMVPGGAPGATQLPNPSQLQSFAQMPLPGRGPAGQ
jgi:hypothetical protein